jgi:hypothetical protein
MSVNRVSQLHNVQQEALDLFEKKNKDYGDAFAVYGTVGVLVRIGDKLSRFTNISNSGVQLVDNEGLRDTLIDLHNYAGMAIMLLDENSEKKYANLVAEVISLKQSGQLLGTFINNYPLTVIKAAGYNATNMRSCGISACDLKNIQFSCSDIKTAGYTILQLIMAKFTANELREAGYTNEQLIMAGMTVKEIYDLPDICGNSLDECKSKVYNYVYDKKLSELRRYCDDDMALKEGGNRVGLCADIEQAKQYAEYATNLYEKENKSCEHLDKKPCTI